MITRLVVAISVLGLAMAFATGAERPAQQIENPYCNP